MNVETIGGEKAHDRLFRRGEKLKAKKIEKAKQKKLMEENKIDPECTFAPKLKSRPPKKNKSCREKSTTIAFTPFKKR